MYAIRAEDIDRSGERRWYRGDEHCETPVFVFFNDECGNESVLNLGQRGLPRVVLSFASQLLSKTSNHCIARDSLQQRVLRSLPGRSPCPGVNDEPNEEAYEQHEQERKDVFSG